MRPAEQARTLTLTLTRVLTGTLTLTLTLTFALRRSLQDGDVASCYHLASPGFRRAAGSAQKFEEVVRENPEYAAAIAFSTIQRYQCSDVHCTPIQRYAVHTLQDFPLYDIPLAAARFTSSLSLTQQSSHRLRRYKPLVKCTRYRVISTLQVLQPATVGIHACNRRHPCLRS